MNERRLLENKFSEGGIQTVITCAKLLTEMDKIILRFRFGRSHRVAIHGNMAVFVGKEDVLLPSLQGLLGRTGIKNYKIGRV